MGVQDTIDAIGATLSPSSDAATPPPSAVQSTIDAINATLNGRPRAGLVESTPGVRYATDDDLASQPASFSSTPRSKPIALSDVPADIGKSFGTGIEKGAIGLLGLPGDIENLAHRGFSYVVDPLLDKAFGPPKPAPTAEPGSFDDIARNTGDYAGGAGITKGVENVAGPLYKPQSVPGEFAQSVGEFVPGAGRSLIAGAVLPGLASEAAGQATKNTGLEPYARIAGGVAGGLTGALAGPAVSGAVKGVGRAIEPMTKAGPEAIAARSLASETNDVPAARAALNQSVEIVPGSVPTTFQATGDVGLGQLERKMRTNSETAPSFIARDQAQNKARVDALGDVQEGGSPADVASRFRQLRDDLDQRTQAAIDSARPAAEDAAAAIGGTGTADSTGYMLRQPMTAARAAAKAHEDALWSIPNQEAGVPVRNLADTARDISRSVTKSATQMAGEEQRVFGVAGAYPDIVRFGDLKDLRSSVNTAIAEAKGVQNDQAVRRLTMLRGGIEDAIDHAVENQHALEDIAVRRGQMVPDETIASRMAAWQREFERQDSLTSSRGDLGTERARASAGSPRISGEESPRGWGYRSSDGDQGLSPGLGQGNSSLGPAGGVARRPPPTLVDFLKSRGGVRDDGGNLTAMGSHRQFPGLVKPNGMSPDQARAAAAEA